MVGGPRGGISILVPHTRALEVLGIMQHWCLAEGRGVHHVPIEITPGASDRSGRPDKVVGPLAVHAVVHRLAHAVTRLHCCVQACTGCYKAKSEGVAHGVHYQSNPFLLEVSGAGRC